VEAPIETHNTELLDRLVDHIEAGEQDRLRDTLAELHPAQNADLLEALPPAPRSALWEAMPAEQEGEILAHLHEEVRTGILEDMAPRELAAAVKTMEPEDLAEVLDELPEDRSERLVRGLEEDYRKRLEAVRSFEEGTAGRLMSAAVISVRKDVTLAVVLRWLRRHESLPSHTDAIMVVNPEGAFEGKLDLAAVVTGNPDALVEEVMEPEAEAVRGEEPEKAVVTLFERRDLVSVPVLDAEGKLLGRITVDDAMDAMRRESDRMLLHSAGLEEEEDLFAPVLPSARRRGVWLGINLITVFLAAWVIGRFQAALDQIVALAVLMPIVASMGGIAGSQTLTLTIRGLALDQIAASNVRWLTFKEVGVGLLNGLAWALVVAVVSYLWFGNPGIAGVIAVAMVLNLFVATASGVAIPLLLRRLGIDPALSGAVILTTVTDVVGFLSFLGLASWLLL
jgi:magnesium transporter